MRIAATQLQVISDHPAEQPDQPRADHQGDAAPAHASNLPLPSTARQRDPYVPGQPRLRLGDAQGTPLGEAEARDTRLAGHGLSLRQRLTKPAGSVGNLNWLSMVHAVLPETQVGPSPPLQLMLEAHGHFLLEPPLRDRLGDRLDVDRLEILFVQLSPRCLAGDAQNRN